MKLPPTEDGVLYNSYRYIQSGALTFVFMSFERKHVVWFHREVIQCVLNGVPAMILQGLPLDLNMAVCMCGATTD